MSYELKFDKKSTERTTHKYIYIYSLSYICLASALGSLGVTSCYPFDAMRFSSYRL